jgi:NAD(P)-dependent dehydrogenase (short-subunit alcohol dehydrogenase family)
MVMGVVEQRADTAQEAGLTGARVLITGLRSRHGVEIARAFAEQGCRLVLQTPEMNRDLQVVLELIAADAEEVHLSETPITDDATALKLAQWAAGACGGLDVVINLARLDDTGLGADADARAIEDRITAALSAPFRITQVIANRMQLTWKEGLILNIVTQGPAATPAAVHLGAIARGALASITRQEAKRWAGSSVRVNAVVPAGEPGCAPDAFEEGLTSEGEIADLAVRLAGGHGRDISGLTFDAALVS